MSEVKTALDAAGKAWQAVVDLAEQHTRWTAELDARRAELDALRHQVGERLLADPTQAGTLAEQQARLEITVQQAEQAVAAATANMPALRRECLLAQIAALKARASAMEQAAERHDQRTQELLAPVIEHEGAPVKAITWSGQDGHVGRTPRSVQLRSAVRELRDLARQWQRTLDADRPDRDTRIAAALRGPQTDLAPLEAEYIKT